MGKRTLIPGENVDRESPRGPERLEAVGLAIQAEQDQWRIQGNGIEGVGGQANELAPGSDGRDHGDSRREAAEGVAKGAAVHRAVLGGICAASPG